MKILQYSNSWGHLFMSLALLAVAVVLLLTGTPTLQGVGVATLGAVQTMWIVPAASGKNSSQGDSSAKGS